MKKLPYFIGVILFFIVFSCAKDKGNYDYKDAEKIEITGLEPSYSVISQKDTLKIFPQVKSNKEGELEYRWGIYETNVQGRTEPLDTIARSQALNYFIQKNAATWVLVFIVKNKKTGFTQYKNTSLAVSTLFTRGWYVLKDDGLNSDLDLFFTPKTILADGKMENVYSQTNTKKIEGKGGFLAFASNYKSNVLNPNLFSNTRTLYVATDKDVQAIGINNLKYLRDKESLFLGGSRLVNGVTGIFNGSAALYAINQGQLYNIYAMSANSGQFGGKVMLDANNTNYELSKYMLSNASIDPILFDQLGSSFVTLGNGYGSTLTTYSDMPDNDFSAAKNNQNVLFLGIKNNIYLPAPDYYYKTVGYAILQDKADPSLKSLALVEKNKFALTLKKTVIEPSTKLYQGSFYSLLYEDENLLYFVYNNQVYSRNLSNGFEQLQFATPAGEEITFIKHLKYTEAANTGYSFNYVLVGSKQGGEYKVRMFTKSAGNLNSIPVQTLSGKGNATAIVYISPSTTEYTYPNSY